MSAIPLRRSARIAAKAAKAAAVSPPAPIKLSRKERTAELLRDVVETSNWLFNQWKPEKVDDKDYLTEYIEGGRTRLIRMGNNIEDTMKAIRRQLPKNHEYWVKVVYNLEYGTRFVIWAIKDYMPYTKDSYFIKNDADWILRHILGHEDVWC